MTTFDIVPRGPSSLEAARSFAGGFAASIGGGEATAAGIVMAFPVEGWSGSAAAGARRVGGQCADVPSAARAECAASRSHMTIVVGRKLADWQGYHRLGSRAG